jgi:DNA-directed RNA polymerase subunit beta
MTKIIQMGRRERLSYAKIPEVMEIPDLVEIQKKSYRNFLQKDSLPKERRKRGLQGILEDVFPIVDFSERMVLEFAGYSVDEPKQSRAVCSEKDLTYSVPLRMKIRLVNRETQEVKEQEIFMGELPLMTEQGTFLINGAERVIVSQLQKSPGVSYSLESKAVGEEIYLAKITPSRGAWLEFEIDSNDVLAVRIDRKRKFLSTAFIRALGYSTNREILSLFSDLEKVNPQEVINKKTGEIEFQFDYPKIKGRTVFEEVIDCQTGEVILEANQKIESDSIKKLKNADVESLVLTKGSEGSPIIKNTLERDNLNSTGEARIAIYRRLRPSDPATLENANSLFRNLFFDSKRYDLSEVGRYKLNQKLNLNIPLSERTLRPEDVIETIRYLLKLREGKGSFDDIDHLGNRRIRSVGELLESQFRVGLGRMKRIAQERMAIQDIDAVTPQTVINIKPIMGAINEFFGGNPLSQFMDQTNPLAELTHKRRLSALGPEGLTRERAGYEVRDVHPTHYGRICPIETPEGPNIGLIVSLSTYAKVNDLGFIETPYRKIDKNVVTDRVEYLTAGKEDKFIIAQANAPLDKKGKFSREEVRARFQGDFLMVKSSEPNYMDVSPKQLVSISTALIPFLEHDDANRALMGSNMQRQAVPLVSPKAPLVGTGMEHKVARDSGAVVVARRSGIVEEVSSEKIVIRANDKKYKLDNIVDLSTKKPFKGLFLEGRTLLNKKTGEVIEEEESLGIDVYKLLKFKRSNQDTAINQKPLVRKGDKVSAGESIADGPATEKGELALGRDVLVAFMPWEGYNFEDAILISEKLVKESLFTSIHIQKYETSARDTRFGKEEITRDIPNISEEALKDLDEEGIIRLGAEVKAGDILVGKVTPKGEVSLSAEEKLLRSIFGEKAREVRDTSLRMPNGSKAKVIDIKVFDREKGNRKRGDVLPPGVNKLVKVFIAQKRKITVGDKMAGRHGNKGVVARVLPEEDMPFLSDGTPVEIALNPLSVPSRMNLGQILETHLGWAAYTLNRHVDTPVFDGAREEEIREMLKEAGLPLNGQTVLYDGRTGEPFDEKVTVGYIYMMKLSHLVEDKIHARSIGPYSLVTQQPLGGKAQFGGQRFGEMEVWAMEAYGAAHALQELLTVKSDDVSGRTKIYEAIVKGENPQAPGVPESFNVLVKELQSLGLDVELITGEGKQMDPNVLYENLEERKK